MKNWCTKLFISIVILLNGYGSAYAHHNIVIFKKFSFCTLVNNVHNEPELNRGRSFESFKRKICLFDNEENEDNFSAAQKQPAKNNYFLIFHSTNHFVHSATAFTQKVNGRKIFSLLDNKVYLLFQVFRI
ncbi:hypothetical protein JI750_12935 [Flavobacterium sp. GN10]|jgi:hypothetical protein|uniref:Uncharacterized protein n=1 Tax=Flavobacterium tagetis TaxID=2801336 RepID=A0ABS1KET6_9FLAO|nr:MULTISPECIES: hypothetical protein [Flavobacterium]MBL0737803.1 hypothetical protein [Flavobacterium tagetis]WJS93416.1 hypothetical protein NYQ10_15090 [Flavobacterium johnsoniae]